MFSALLRKRDQQYLADATVPSHPLQARGGQDDGREILLVVQLFEPSVQVPSLERGAMEAKEKLTLLGVMPGKPPSTVRPWEPPDSDA